MPTKIERPDLKWLYEKLGLTEKGRQVIEHIRNNEPVRRIDGGGYSVISVYSSKNKMKCGIQTESRSVEYPYVIEREFDPNTLEFWDQPYRLKLTYTRKDGRKISHLHTPDYLVINKDEIYFVECKEESRLLTLAQKQPEKFIYGDDGTWRCPPAEEAVAELGVGYRIISSRDLSAVFTRNCNFLSDYLLQPPPEDLTPIKCAIDEFFNKQPYGTLKDLLDSVDDADSIYWGIAQGFFYVDLWSDLVVRPEATKVYVNETYANALVAAHESSSATTTTDHIVHLEPGRNLLWDNISWSIINVGSTDIVMVDEADNIVTLKIKQLEQLVKKGDVIGAGQSVVADNSQILLHASKDELTIANQRFEKIKPFVSATEHDCALTKPDRTQRLWIKQYHDAATAFGTGFIGLIPRLGDRGNRTSRLHPEVRELLNDIIENVYKTPVCPNKKTVFNQLVTLCDERGLDPCSYETVCVHIRSKDKKDIIRARLGKRAAYQEQGPLPSTELDLPPNGDRAWEVAHIDHTLVALKIISSITGEVLGQLWLTLLVDGFSKKILSHFLTFDPPSYRSSMMVMRECVRRHGRLPSKIISDRGPDFRSVYFDVLVNNYCDEKLLRPTAEPKYGEPVERTFGTTDQGLIDILMGNTKNLKLGRKLSSTHHSDKHAVWTADAFDELLTDWLYNVYPTLKNTGTGETPDSRFRRSIDQTGIRKHKFIPYDQQFIINTMPTPKRTPTIRSRDGIRVNYFIYWAPELGLSELSGKKVDVRYDPFDASYVYAYVQNTWVRCVCRHQMLREFTERDINKAAEELRQLRRIAKRDYRITPEILLQYLNRVRAKESDLIAAKAALKSKHRNFSEKQTDISISIEPAVITDDVQMPQLTFTQVTNKGGIRHGI